jgi:hypothetical protein
MVVIAVIAIVVIAFAASRAVRTKQVSVEEHDMVMPRPGVMVHDPACRKSSCRGGHNTTVGPL